MCAETFVVIEMDLPTGLDPLDREAAELLIAEAARATEFARAGGSLGYMEYMQLRKPGARSGDAAAPVQAAPGGVDGNGLRGAPTRPEEGAIYDGVVMSVKSYGAFVDFGFDQDGLVHVSKICEARLETAEEMLYPGDRVTVRADRYEPSGRTSLSMVGLNPGLRPTDNRSPPPRPRRRPRPAESKAPRADSSSGSAAGPVPDDLGGFRPPAWAVPARQGSEEQLEVTKDGKMVKLMPVTTRACYLFGRDKRASGAIYLRHLSISRQHAALVHDREGRALLIDCGSSHGTFVNGTRVAPGESTQLRRGDTFTLGASTREYRLVVPDQAQESEQRRGTVRSRGSSRGRSSNRDRRNDRSRSRDRRRRRQRRRQSFSDTSDDEDNGGAESTGLDLVGGARNRPKQRLQDRSDDEKSPPHTQTK